LDDNLSFHGFLQKNDYGEELILWSKRVSIIDTHTGGEPTRIVLSGGPNLGSGSLVEQRKIFQDRYEKFRSAVVNEPRGGDVWVGGILCAPMASTSTAGIIFFNNVGALHMCGHGTIGLITALFYLGKIEPGVHEIDTPAGTVKAKLHRDGQVTLTNVLSYRYLAAVTIDVPGESTVTGDVAWGGNWFFLTDDHDEEIHFSNIDRLTELTMKIRHRLQQHGISGENGAPIDHIELFGPGDSRSDSRNFVLCPGNAYDRSPCGTGTSAKIACLMADKKLRSGQLWRQQSIIGSVFEASGTWRNNLVSPEITGRAFVNAESTLVFDSKDPFTMGITGETLL